MKMPEQIKPLDGPVILKTRVIITCDNGVPQIEIRKKITNLKNIQDVIRAVLYEQPINIIPMFSDPMKSWAQLHEKGIIYSEKDSHCFVLKEG